MEYFGIPKPKPNFGGKNNDLPKQYKFILSSSL